MAGKDWIEVKCIQVTQPIGTFYVGSIGYRDLIEITYSDVLRIERHEQREVEIYLGIERPLSPKRVSSLQRYVRTIDATFPTSVLITLKPEDVEYDSSSCVMRIRRDHEVAKIIDGQHRIEGLKSFAGEAFDVNVTMFVDMALEDQGMVFSIINLEQTKVNKSIVYSLYEYASIRSPQKTAHNIAKILNIKEKSPFKNRIKILGAGSGRPTESITQGTFVEALLPLLSRDPMADRDNLKRGERLAKISGSEERKLIFRNMFIDDRDADIVKVLWNYFAAVENKWFDAWFHVAPGDILNRTTGFCALMRFLPLAYNHAGAPADIVTAEAFRDMLHPVTLKKEDFNPERYKPGSSGINALFQDLCAQTGIYE